MAAVKLKKMYQPNMEFVQKNRSHLSVAKFETEFISRKISRKSVDLRSYETERSPVWRGSFGVAPQLAAWKEEERKLQCGSTSSRRHLSPLRLRWVARRGSGRELEDRGGTTSWCGGGGASRLWSMDSEDEALWSSRLSYQPGTGKAEKERRQGRELRGTGEHGGGGLEK
uniref:Uncharacterized protein n=1 Tax=Brassica oleracea var. oleracea TaxID=109376 RepID=A0A0D3AIW5_BRAOL